jgi:uncharacterized membrane protein YoaK (UPF0700 family)
LSVTAGYVDTAGYLALQGLFSAHVTGNFVTLGPMDKKDAAQARLARMSVSVLAFASGCAAAAQSYSLAGVYCFLVPPLLGASTLVFRMGAFEGDIR